MGFFASWWERVPVRRLAPSLMALLAIASTFDQLSAFARSILGFSWG
jgi:hypothetical protein